MNSKNNPTLRSTKIRVGITFGDPSGIGPAIIAKALAALGLLADFRVIGDRSVFGLLRPKSILPSFIDLNNINHKKFEFGKVSAESGRASVEYLDKALELLEKGQIDCLVTCPVSKEAVNKAGFAFSGHTEYLASRTNTKDFVMLLLNDRLKISLVTRHIPLEKVSSGLNARELSKNIMITSQALKRQFGFPKPRIVVCGLNPHASDNGLLGKEENLLIAPVLNRLRKKLKIRLVGPLSADIAIHKAYIKEYDGVIAMYHDQALIPLKLCANSAGVNMTLGLPFVRTSPLHGVAFDIAKNPKAADPRSLIAAIKLAVKCCHTRKKD